MVPKKECFKILETGIIVIFSKNSFGFFKQELKKQKKERVRSSVVERRAFNPRVPGSIPGALILIKKSNFLGSNAEWLRQPFPKRCAKVLVGSIPTGPNF